MGINVASTIYQQLGGNRFAAMTGAQDFLNCGDSLDFRVPSRSTKDGINRVRITLEPSDTYRVKFMRQRGTSIKTVSEHEDIYWDELQPLFTRKTGLLTRL